jgi:hypothetical protein
MNLTQWLQIGITSFVIPAVMGSGCLATLTGCAFIKPTTKMGGGPFGWEFVDTKDNNVSVKNLIVDPKTKVITVEELILTNAASPVIEANVQQMLAFVEQQKQATAFMAALAPVLQAAVSALPGVVGVPQPASIELTADPSIPAVEDRPGPSP